MPYASDRQRKYLHAKKPEVAERFDRDIRAGRKKATKKVAAKRKKK